MKIILLITLLTPSIVSADKLILWGISHHFGLNNSIVNESHPAIGVEMDSGLEYGVYYNSVRRSSVFVSKVARPIKLKNGFSAGYRVGVASGYVKHVKSNNPNKDGVIMPATYKGFMPQAQLIMSHESKYITVDLGLSVVSTIIFKINV